MFVDVNNIIIRKLMPDQPPEPSWGKQTKTFRGRAATIAHPYDSDAFFARIFAWPR